MNGLREYLEQVILKEGISKDLVITVEDKKGRPHQIPIAAIIEFLSTLKKELRILVYKKFAYARRKSVDLIPVFNELAVPMVNRRI